MTKASKKLGVAIVTLLTLVSGTLLPGIAHASTAGYTPSDVIGQPNFTSNATGLSASSLNYPTGSVLDSGHHRLFTNDCGNNRVLVFDLDANNNLISHDASYVLGQPDFTTNTSLTTQNGTSCPYLGISYDATNNRLFYVDNGNNRVLIYDLAGGITNGMAASYVLGQPDFTSGGNALTATGLSIDVQDASYDPSSGYLFVADTRYHRVLVYNVAPNVVSNGMAASYVLGQPDFTSNAVATTQNGFNQPETVMVNPVTHQLFVGDSTNYRVLVFNLAGGITTDMNASYVLGQPDFTTTSGAHITQNQFGRYIEGLGIDTSRNVLYVADEQNDRVLVFNLAGGITNNMNASLVLGSPDFTTNLLPSSCYSNSSYVASITSICDPETSIAVDSVNNRVYLSASSENRLLIFNFAKLTRSLPAMTIHSAFSQQLGSQTEGTPTYSVVSGRLPAGLNLNSASGLLSGTPTTTGNYSFSVKLVDDNGSVGTSTDQYTYSGTVNVPSLVAPATGYGTAHGSRTWVWLLALGSAMLLVGLARYLHSRRSD